MALAEKLTANASQLAAAGKNVTAAAAHLFNATINGTLLTGNVTNGTRFIDVEEDRIAPGYAVLLMYIMLVSARHEAAAAPVCMRVQQGAIYQTSQLLRKIPIWQVDMVAARAGLWQHHA
jgi:hypothetical protein